MVADRPTRPTRPERPDRAEGSVAAGFAVVRRGYDPDAVEAYLRRLDVQLQILAADRDAALEQSRQMGVELEACRARVERLRGQVSALSGPLLTVASTSERVRSMLRLVEDDIVDLPSRVLALGGWCRTAASGVWPARLTVHGVPGFAEIGTGGGSAEPA